MRGDERDKRGQEGSGGMRDEGGEVRGRPRETLMIFCRTFT